jgi:hypothetical protein
MLQNSTNSFDEDKSRHSMLVAGEGKLKENRQRERRRKAKNRATNCSGASEICKTLSSGVSLIGSGEGGKEIIARKHVSHFKIRIRFGERVFRSIASSNTISIFYEVSIFNRSTERHFVYSPALGRLRFLLVSPLASLSLFRGDAM